MQTSHAITITTTYVDETRLGVKTLQLRYLPDSLRIPVKSDFDKIPFPLTASQALVYQGTTPPEINFSLKIVAGLDDFNIYRSVKLGPQESNLGTTDPINKAFEQLDYLDRLKLLCKELYSLALPESSLYGNKTLLPPPKSVMTIGSMFRGAGVFDNIDIEFFGPYDENGRPQEIEVHFNFLVSQFYDPKRGGNPVGINMQTANEQISKEGRQALSGFNPQDSSNNINKLLVQAPSGAQMSDSNFGPYIIWYGGNG